VQVEKCASPPPVEFVAPAAIVVASAVDAQGLASPGTAFSIWNPETDTVTIHKLHIIRGGQTMAGDDFRSRFPPLTGPPALGPITTV
jgi:hypothetical protein